MKKGITALPAAPQALSPQAIADCRRQSLADRGDVWGLLESLSHSDPGSLKWKEEFDRILDLLLSRAHQRPQEFAAEVLDRLSAVSTFFLLRAELYVRQLTCEAANADRYQPASDLPRPVVEHFLPRYQDLGRFTAEILHYRASIARQWALARAKEAETARRLEKPVSASREAVAPPNPSTNGHNGKPTHHGNNGHTPPNGRFSFPP
jgi:hypothetical protein